MTPANAATLDYDALARELLAAGEDLTRPPATHHCDELKLALVRAAVAESLAEGGEHSADDVRRDLETLRQELRACVALSS